MTFTTIITRSIVYFLQEAVITVTKSRIGMNQIQKYLEELEVEMDQESINVPESIASEIMLARVGWFLALKSLSFNGMLYQSKTLFDYLN
ncbi:hypothetical protein G6F56_008543 [Rhizopus delemar]|nr:hypothetical protein G6F56_008543 [Rhizopus delemar]